ncbi:hypothetical protein RJ55_04440 [Drechmeria coniospora]|nr:hypothetical protein RJ55_04440 [Drechmeria coniospora]
MANPSPRVASQTGSAAASLFEQRLVNNSLLLFAGADVASPTGEQSEAAQLCTWTPCCCGVPASRLGFAPTWRQSTLPVVDGTGLRSLRPDRIPWLRCRHRRSPFAFGFGAGAEPNSPTAQDNGTAEGISAFASFQSPGERPIPAMGHGHGPEGTGALIRSIVPVRCTGEGPSAHGDWRSKHGYQVPRLPGTNAHAPDMEKRLRTLFRRQHGVCLRPSWVDMRDKFVIIFIIQRTFEVGLYVLLALRGQADNGVKISTGTDMSGFESRPVTPLVIIQAPPTPRSAVSLLRRVGA